jgi:hypothetical protein
VNEAPVYAEFFGKLTLSAQANKDEDPAYRFHSK